MRNLAHILSLLALMLFPAVCYPQTNCSAPPLSEQQVTNIISRERATRSDLPKPFPQYRWTVKTQGCHYIYIENGLPETPGKQHIFRMNRLGVIVDAQAHGQAIKLNCPDKVFTESELAEIIKKERKNRPDVPSPFPNHRVRVDRLGCLYLYFEYAVPESRGNYHTFIIDPFGELMEIHRAQPY